MFSLLPMLVPGCSALAAGADLAGSQAHPSSSPARMTRSAPCSLGFKVCQGALKWPHAGSRTSPIAATREAPATGPLLPGKFVPAHLSWKDPTLHTSFCSKLCLVVTARGYSPYLYCLQKVGSSIEELFHGYTNKNVLMSYFPAASEHSECSFPTKSPRTARADGCLLQSFIIWTLKAL